MLTIIQNIFGTYVPITNTDGTIAQGLAGVNFEWLAGFILFALMLWCSLRILGGVIKRG